MLHHIRILIIAGLVIAACAVGTGVSFVRLPADQADASLFSAAIEATMLIMGGMIAAAMFYAETLWHRRTETAEHAEEEAVMQRRVQWALRRLSVEIIDAIENTQALIEDATQWSLTVLADDVYATSKFMLRDHMQCGPARYAIIDFYKSLRALQIVEEERFRYIVRGQDPEQAHRIVAVQAQMVIDSGEYALAMLRLKGQDVIDRIEERIALGPNFAHPAKQEALKQARDECDAQAQAA